MSEPAKKIDTKVFSSVPFELKALPNSEDLEYFYFEGYLSTWNNIDRGDDIILKGAFTDSLKKLTPDLRWQHEYNSVIGIFTEMKEDSVGLFVKGKLPREDSIVSGRVIPQMKVGSVRSMSIGYWAQEFDYDESGIRVIKKAMLFEGSLVSQPMNSEAVVTDMKKFEIDSIKTIETKRDLEKILRELGLSQKAAVYLASRTDFDSSDSDVVKANGELAKELKRLTETINKL